MLQANNISVGYYKKDISTAVAEGLSFALQKGKLTCLLGPNGVGKSTLIKSIMGQLPLLEGSLILEGQDIKNFSSRELARKIAVVLTEKVSTGNLNVYQLVSLGRIPHTGWLGKLSDEDKEKVGRAIALTHIGYLQNKKLSELSDGQLQKVMIARALCQDGEILILDEPTAHLDLVNRYEIMHLLRDIALKEKKAILVVTHDLDIAIDTADVFWLMQCGFPLEAGAPEDLILQGKLNRLLPEGNLVFDPLNGKVQESKKMVYPEITGDASAVKWIQNALKKTRMDFSNNDLKLQVQEAPFRILLNGVGAQKEIESIEDLIDFLSER